MNQQEFDIIVIGSGMGSLAFSSIMAQMKASRILILERHFKPGGFTHMFQRPGGFEWDVGIHYVGEMTEGNLIRDLMDMVTRGKVVWNRIPSPYDIFSYPGLTFEIPTGVDAYRAAIVAAFPDEERAIFQYFQDVKKVYGLNDLRMLANSMRPPLRNAIHWLVSQSKVAFESTASYLKSRFRSPKLRGLLATQWAAYGLAPKDAPFIIHATIVTHYLEGGFYPVRGGSSIAEAVLPIIESKGGQCKLNHKVTEIIVEDGRAVGVRIAPRKSGATITTEYYAPMIVSGAGAYTTYKRLMPTVHSKDLLETMDRIPVGTSFVTLYLGLNENPAKLGFHGENQWIFSGFDHDEIFNHRNEIAEGRPGGAFLSFPSLKDSSQTRHTAIVIAPLDYSVVERWSSQLWKRRGDDYQQLKDRISRGLLDIVEQRYPGFTNLVEFSELSTPITVENFTGHMNGAIYGLPSTEHRFKGNWLKVETPVHNLLLTGSDIGTLGIAGAMFGGVVTAGYLQGGLGILKVISAAKSKAWKNWS